MTELQSRLLEMLKWFHSFCMENNIKYYALGGTALGAIRHNGFIPWDDDIDVGMPREEYNKLIFLMSKKNENTQYEIEVPLQNKN
jgi:lipopolysaccharide cholinephosphotransferase